MNAKLKLDRRVIEQAKEYARQHQQSLSMLVESLLRGVVTGRERQLSDSEITPRVKRLTGVIGSMPNLKEDESIFRYLMKKHS